MPPRAPKACAPFAPFVLIKPRREVDYEAKTVTLAGRRSIVCRNLDKMNNDAANRATIVAAFPINLDAKQMGGRSAGNPQAAFDVAGTGDVARSRY